MQFYILKRTKRIQNENVRRMKQTFFQIKNSSDGTPEILLYGYIGDGEGLISAAEFAKELKDLEKSNKTINVRINSGGGSVFEGIAIYSVIKNSPATINTYIDGIAASMGSVIALAGKKVYMSSMAQMMTHKTSGIAGGSAEDIRQYATLMDGLEDTLCAIYANKTGLSKDEAAAQFLGQGDKWMNAQEALAAKLVDEVFNVDAKVKISPAANAERDVWAAYSETLNQKNDMDTKFLAAKLGMSDTATETEIAAKLSAVLMANKNAETLKTENDTLKNEVIKLKADQDNAKIETLVQGAIDAKKLIAGDKERYVKLAKADFDTTKEIIDAMKPYDGMESRLKGGGDSETNALELEQLLKLSGKELYMQGKLERLQALSEPHFKLKYKEAFGVDYKA